MHVVHGVVLSGLAGFMHVFCVQRKKQQLLEGKQQHECMASEQTCPVHVQQSRLILKNEGPP